MNVLITGGSGFIGTNFIKKINTLNFFTKLVNLDKNTLSTSYLNLSDLNNPNYIFIEGDIKDHNLINKLFNQYDFNLIIHFAAESHVDKSINDPESFMQTNILGTYNLLEQSRRYIEKKNDKSFKFIHVSTDEVYGTLKNDEDAFSESYPYLPNSPYAASKASSDLIVRSYVKTFNFPAIITNCSNNYGPYQYPEKLIPLVINNCLSLQKIPIYGNGKQIRDWLHVEDHCTALLSIIKNGKIGEKYNIGGGVEITNLDMVNFICSILDEIRPKGKGSYRELISFVQDRPGHDTRYAINNSKIKNEINWKPLVDFDEGLRMTVKWYLDNPDWIKNIKDKNYQNWIDVNYKNR